MGQTEVQTRAVGLLHTSICAAVILTARSHAWQSSKQRINLLASSLQSPRRECARQGDRQGRAGTRAGEGEPCVRLGVRRHGQAAAGRNCAFPAEGEALYNNNRENIDRAHAYHWRGDGLIGKAGVNTGFTASVTVTVCVCLSENHTGSTDSLFP